MEVVSMSFPASTGDPLLREISERFAAPPNLGAPTPGGFAFQTGSRLFSHVDSTPKRCRVQIVNWTRS